MVFECLSLCVSLIRFWCGSYVKTIQRSLCCIVGIYGCCEEYVYNEVYAVAQILFTTVAYATG
ncbi:hypothetical protein KSS87_011247 [Heliosperma pusillum]|nr:hypothetical protein KSS87_011247 [Heliosperma pusillum]